jgi:hypothetical protein
VRAPIAGDVGQEFSEAGSCVQVISAADSSIIEFANQLETTLGERFNGLTLALIAVFVGADIGRAGRAQIGDGLGLENLWEAIDLFRTSNCFTSVCGLGVLTSIRHGCWRTLL